MTAFADHSRSRTRRKQRSRYNRRVRDGTNTDGTRDYRLWPTFDANFNVTSLVTDQGGTDQA
jgi:hypothetical protein